MLEWQFATLWELVADADTFKGRASRGEVSESNSSLRVC